eukprot:15343661-Ditylum_brightwellii.AAC.1
MLQLSITLIKNYDKPKGKLNNFERTASFTIPSDFVARKVNDNNGCSTADVSGVKGSRVVASSEA